MSRLYEVYEEETHFFREIVRAESADEAYGIFQDRRRRGEVWANDIDILYGHVIPEEG